MNPRSWQTMHMLGDRKKAFFYRKLYGLISHPVIKYLDEKPAVFSAVASIVAVPISLAASVISLLK